MKPDAWAALLSRKAERSGASFGGAIIRFGCSRAASCTALDRVLRGTDAFLRALHKSRGRS